MTSPTSSRDPGGRPTLPCSKCGGPREGGKYVKVGGKKLRLCARCAREARNWSGPDLKPDERRGTRRGSREGVVSRGERREGSGP